MTRPHHNKTPSRLIRAFRELMAEIRQLHKNVTEIHTCAELWRRGGNDELAAGTRGEDVSMMLPS